MTAKELFLEILEKEGIDQIINMSLDDFQNYSEDEIISSEVYKIAQDFSWDIKTVVKEYKKNEKNTDNIK